MTQLNVSSIISQARKVLLESNNNILSDEQLLTYANLTKDDIAKRVLTPDRIKSTSIAFSSGTATKPTDFESHLLSRDSQTPGVGNSFVWVNLEDYRLRKFDRMLTVINGEITVYPADTSITYTDYYIKVDDMVLGGVCTLREELQEIVKLGILYRSFQDLQDFELADLYRKNYELDMGIKQKAISYSDETQQQDGELFNPIRII